jgi:hypothetical protein
MEFFLYVSVVIFGLLIVFEERVKNYLQTRECQHTFTVKSLKGIDAEFMRCNFLIECTKCGKSIRAKAVSDGYHTFEELYEHRSVLFISLMKQMPEKAFWTRKNKEGEEWPGWIIVGINDPIFGQISYHVSSTFIPLLDGIQEIPYNEKFDGHTSEDVLDRLKKL